ncbi:tetratricopeptide repeat protein [Flavobacterium sp. FlaQc-57]|uniref:tetratricopeptide repeat protein n=1 Tax=Flavobacterium sp. FlaQc-57 TaxID=3374186 RepID=UPI00375726F4
MKNKKYFVCFICFLVNLSFAQAPLPPPPPKKNTKAKDLIYGDPSKTDNKKDEKSTAKVKEVKSSAKAYKEDTQKSVQNFNVPITESTNPGSIYYYKNVETLLQKLDTTAITNTQIISLTKYKIHSNAIRPASLDSLARKAYKLNEDKNYNEAIVTSKQILKQSPNNISGYKELAYAYKRLGNEELSNRYFEMMVKIITSIFQYGEGSRKSPYILNNFFEGISIYEAKFGCYPNKVTLILTKEKKLLGGYDCYHIMRFSNLTHWLPLLKKDDYKIEE